MSVSLSNDRVANLCRSISLVLAGCLPFIVPLDIARSIDIQGWLLIIAGVFVWFAIFVNYKRVVASWDYPAYILLGVYIISCVLNLLINHHGYDFLGAPLMRLGTLGLLACIGIGILATSIIYKKLVASLYLLLAGLVAVSLPYSWLHAHSLVRIGGVFAQADILACFIGCGLLIGMEMLTLYPELSRVLWSFQGFLMAMLLLTQTRAVLLFTVLLLAVWIFRHQDRKLLKQSVLYLFMAFVFFIALGLITPNRLTSPAYASRSFHYRLSLQAYALQASEQEILTGYGPGNLSAALSCSHLTNKSLQATCHEGYYFNSSHNIFIDRVLAVGWFGGLAFLGLVGVGIYRGFRKQSRYQGLVYPLILISCYYFTNVTSITLELLFCVLLFQCLIIRSGNAIAST